MRPVAHAKYTPDQQTRLKSVAWAINQPGTIAGFKRAARVVKAGTPKRLAHLLGRDRHALRDVVIAHDPTTVVFDAAALKRWRDTKLPVDPPNPAPDPRLTPFLESCGATITAAIHHSGEPLSLIRLYFMADERWPLRKLAATARMMHKHGALARERRPAERVRGRGEIWVYSPGARFKRALKWWNIVV